MENQTDDGIRNKPWGRHTETKRSNKNTQEGRGGGS